MKRNWVLFEGKENGADRGMPRITINKSKTIMLNKAAHDAIGRPDAVELFYDRKYGVIGLKSSSAKLNNSFSVKSKKKTAYKVVHASPFCNHFNIQIDGTLLFTEPAIIEGGFIELDLAKTQSSNRGSR